MNILTIVVYFLVGWFLLGLVGVGYFIVKNQKKMRRAWREGKLEEQEEK